MRGNSPFIVSSQREVHPRLREAVIRHRDCAWRAPLHAPSVAAFGRWQAASDASMPLVVDLGCGNGESTLGLTERHPESLILGVDRSSHRLARLAPDGFATHGRAALLRAQAETVLRLLHRDARRIEVLYLLYPNPWPKPEHLRRRWHGHPVFPLLLEISRRVVMRTNWSIYALEFAAAAAYLGRFGVVERLPHDRPDWTPFERKYRASGHDCFEVVLADD